MSETRASSEEKKVTYPPWLYSFPMYVMLFTYALLGRSGYIIVADFPDALTPSSMLPDSEFTLFYILTYGVFFPAIFLGQWIFYRVLSRRFNVRWRDFARGDKALIILYGIAGVFIFHWVVAIFGLNAPYNPALDFDIGGMHVWTGDFLYFIIGGPLFAIGFHGINWAICHKTRDRHQYRFFLTVLGVSVVGTITQDWFWWVSAPTPPWGPGVTIYFYFPEWTQVPFTPIYIPVVYLIVALVYLGIIYLATIKLYNFKQYLLWGMGPYLLLLLVGNILFFAM